MRLSSAVVVLPLLTFLSSFAMADQTTETASGFSLSGDIGITSDYRFRGISNSDNKAAIQGSLNLEHRSGWYAGVWASNVDLDIGTHLETDYYAGYVLPLSENSSVDINYTYFDYPHALRELKVDYGEFAAIYHHDHAFTADDHLSFGVYYSPEFTADSDQEIYLESSYSYPVNSLFNINATVGYTRLKDNEKFAQGVGGNGQQNHYYDYKIGVSKQILGLDADLAWIDNNLKGAGKIAQGQMVLTVGKSF